MDNKTNKMLIDATHPEETRVVVLRSGRVEEFDYESAARKLLRGNIYLAKVTRVEPSLQAAFVEYGGNRHGFLAFNEIHPDYYQIPVSDRQALIDEEAAAEAEADAEADARAERRFQGGNNRDGRRHGGRNGDRRPHRSATAASDAPGVGEQPPADHEGGASHADAASPADDQFHEHAPAPHDDTAASSDHSHTAEDSIAPSHETRAEATGNFSESVSEDHASGEPEAAVAHIHGGDEGAHGEPGSAHIHESEVAPIHVSADSDDDAAHIEQVPEMTDAPETVGAGEDTGIEDDGPDEVQERPRRQRRRQYKIQEVIKRRQIILVQVVKEERGNKGAALTTYLSLAGRYTVLMPNTGRGGGISRKIVNPGDRKRLKAIAQELDVPEGMGLIIRTAGAARTSQEIKRDYEYLLRLWESVREMTLRSTAPSLVYEEGNLIRRSIRDLYTKEIDEIVVAGDQAHSDAHDFMRMLMPSHAKHVTRYAQPDALFTRYQIERQLNAMFSPYVTLKSGGYLVINQTEALVSIDVNSGKSTREYSIEETALATNLEAADEIARQLKLRDLAGLIVIDFIDMEEKRNNRAVERRLTDALRFDRARIQVGRISHFGLMEMSRQRMRTGVLEGSTSQCPHCQGTGMIRSTESVALAVLRGLEDHLVKDARSSVNVLTTASVALYILNNKRSFIVDIEHRYGIVVAVLASERMQGANFAVERSAAPVQPRQTERAAVSMDWGFQGESQAADDAGDEEAGHEEAVSSVEEIDDDNETSQRSEGGEGRGRRRRRRRGRDRDRGERNQFAQPRNEGEAAPQDDEGAPPQGAESGEFNGSDGEADDQHGEFADAPETEAGQPEGHSGDADRGARRGRRRGRRGGRRGREQRAGQTDGAPNGSEAGDEPAEEASADGADDLHFTGDGAPPAHEGHSHASVANGEGAHEAPAHHGDDDHGRALDPAPPAPSTPSETASVHDTQPAAEAPEIAAAAPEVHADHSEPPIVVPVTQLPASPEDPSRPRRRGWWQRRGLGE